MRSPTIVLAVGMAMLPSCGGSLPEQSSPETPSEAEPAPPSQPAPDSADTEDSAFEGNAEEETRTDAPAPAKAAEEPGEEGASSLDVQLDESFESFGEALAAGVPDCAGASRFRNEVCRLAERICALTSGLPSSSNAHAQCDDGKQRCESANRRYADACR